MMPSTWRAYISIFAFSALLLLAVFVLVFATWSIFGLARARRRGVVGALAVVTPNFVTIFGVAVTLTGTTCVLVVRRASEKSIQASLTPLTPSIVGAIVTNGFP